MGVIALILALVLVVIVGLIFGFYYGAKIERQRALNIVKSYETSFGGDSDLLKVLLHLRKIIED